LSNLTHIITVRKNKRQRLAATTVDNNSPLDVYRAQVTACSLKRAERSVILHEANPGHVMLLLSGQQQKQVEGGTGSATSSSAPVPDTSSDTDTVDTIYISFIENYEAIKDILISICSGEHTPAVEVTHRLDLLCIILLFYIFCNSIFDMLFIDDTLHHVYIYLQSERREDDWGV
jgi:hypothetical protein